MQSSLFLNHETIYNIAKQFSSNEKSKLDYFKQGLNLPIDTTNEISKWKFWESTVDFKSNRNRKFLIFLLSNSSLKN